jgi:hypothetical protein
MNSVREALCDVERAFKNLEFAIRFMCYFEQGHVDVKHFDKDLTILFERESINFPAGAFGTPESLNQPVQSLVSIAFGTSAMVLEVAFGAAGIARTPRSRDSESELRTLVYMVRCAFAHNPAFPRWEARGSDYARRFALELDASLLTVDFAALNGQLFDYEHIGGFANWFRVKEASLALMR